MSKKIDEFDDIASFNENKEKSDSDELYKQGLTEINEENVSDDEFNPLAENVIKRDYTKGGATANENIIDQPKVVEIPEPTFSVEDTKPTNPLNPNQNDSPQKDKDKDKGIFSKDKKETPKENPYGGASMINDTIINDSEKKEREDKLRKRDAKKSADVLTVTYAQLIEGTAKYFSRFNIAKLQDLHMRDEIDIDMVVMSDNQTIKDYAEDFNIKVDQNLSLTEEEKEQFSDALADFLLETGKEFTPTQRLLFTMTNHGFRMFQSTIMLVQEKRHALNTFKEFRQQEKENEEKHQQKTSAKQKQSGSTIYEQVNTQQQQQQQQQQPKRNVTPDVDPVIVDIPEITIDIPDFPKYNIETVLDEVDNPKIEDVVPK